MPRAALGFVVPVFFVSSGVRLDLTGLVDQPSAILGVPPFPLALLVVRGLPALWFASVVGRRQTVAIALLEATSLPFTVTASQIGVLTGRLSSITATALVFAGLWSVLVFPPVAWDSSRLRPYEKGSGWPPDRADGPASVRTACPTTSKG